MTFGGAEGQEACDYSSCYICGKIMLSQPLRVPGYHSDCLDVATGASEPDLLFGIPTHVLPTMEDSRNLDPLPEKPKFLEISPQTFLYLKSIRTPPRCYICGRESTQFAAYTLWFKPYMHSSCWSAVTGLKPD